MFTWKRSGDAKFAKGKGHMPKMLLPATILVAVACGTSILVGAACGNSTPTEVGTPDAGEVVVPTLDGGNTMEEIDTGTPVVDSSLPPNDTGVDSSPAMDAGDPCKVGQAKSSTDAGLDLFGSIIYFADGAIIPAGKYRVSYVDGCMKYGGGQGWTVNAFAAGQGVNWRIVAETKTSELATPPGTVGYAVGAGAYANFEDCVTASKAVPPVDFDLPADSRVGVYLKDSPYSDNQEGEGGRNPKWELTSLVGACGSDN